MPERKNFSIIPAGEWGATFGGVVVAGMGHNVMLLLRDPEEVRIFRRIHQIEKLSGVRMPDNVKATANVEEVVIDADVLVLAAKSQSFRRRYRELIPYLQLRRKQPTRLILTKGIEQGSHLRMSEVVLQEDPTCIDYVVCLSGPNLAKEIANGAVAGAVIGSDDQQTRDRLQSWLNSQRFLAYTSDDIVGVELGGALKNVMALGAGMVHALNVSSSTESLYITRALEEMVTLGVSLQAHESTLRGLSGLGDLFLSCYGGATRNFRAGVKLAQGQSVEEVKKAETVEGLYTLGSVKVLAAGRDVSVPLISAIDGVANGGLKINYGVIQLLGQQPSKEQNGHKGLMFNLAIQWRRMRHNLAGVNPLGSHF